MRVPERPTAVYLAPLQSLCQMQKRVIVAFEPFSSGFIGFSRVWQRDGYSCYLISAVAAQMHDRLAVKPAVT